MQTSPKAEVPSMNSKEAHNAFYYFGEGWDDAFRGANCVGDPNWGTEDRNSYRDGFKRARALMEAGKAEAGEATRDAKDGA